MLAAIIRNPIRELNRVARMTPISVLLVDDNVTFLRIATRFLEVQDSLVVVGAVHIGEEAVAQIQDLRPDIVLVDVSVSNGHGLEVISRLRAVQPGVGIIALALVDTDGFWQAALQAGADDFIPKFAMSTNLLPAIRRVIQANQPHGQATRPLEAKPLDPTSRPESPKGPEMIEPMLPVEVDQVPAASEEVEA